MAVAASAAADPVPGEMCFEAYEQAQVSRREGAFDRARADLDLCARQCPTVLARECATWSEELAREAARVTITVVASSGDDVAEALLFIDGRAVPYARGEHWLREGEHEIVAEAGASTLRELVDLKAGESRQIALRLPPPPVDGPSTEVATEAPSPAGPIVLASSGLALALVGGGLGIAGHVRVSDLRDTCAPGCDGSDVDAVRTMWIVGGVLAGVGVTAIAGATAWWVGQSGGGGAEQETSSPRLLPQLVVAPGAPGGAGASRAGMPTAVVGLSVDGVF